MSKPTKPLIPCTRPEGIPWRVAPDDSNTTAAATGSCGHTVWQYEHVAIGSQQIGNSRGPRFGGIAKFFARTSEECGDCLLKETLERAACCARCGNPILVGDLVSILGHPDPTTELLPFLAYATRPTEPRNCFLFCMRCCPGAIAVTGRWTGTDVRPLDVSPLDVVLSGNVVVSSDGRIASVPIGDE